MFASSLRQSGSKSTANRRAFAILFSVAALLSTCFVGTSQASQAETAVQVASADSLKRPQLEVTASSLPRFDEADGTGKSSRLDVTIFPQPRSGLGFSLGMTNTAGQSFGSVPASLTSPLVNLGVHWRYHLDDNYRFDVTAYRRVSNVDAISLIRNRDPDYGARVEMRMGSVTSKGFVADKGFVGFQLESGAKITIKRRRGAPMVYYRNSF